MVLPTGTLVCLMEKTRPRKCGGESRASRCEPAGLAGP